MAISGQQPQGLESRVQKLYFEVTADLPSAEGIAVSSTTIHDVVQAFLQENGLWSPQFRYGCAAANYKTEMELRSDGFSRSQRQVDDATLVLYKNDPLEDSRDFYCNRHFFDGEQVIAIYDINQLQHVRGRSYKLLHPHPSALVAIVAPVFRT